MIRFEQVGKRYANGHVGLHELSFRVRRGEFLFVTGHSGAGKSTLLRLLLAVAGFVLLGRRGWGTTLRSGVETARTRTASALALFASWLVINIAVFSYMAGIYHDYYTVALAPAVAAVAGMQAALWFMLLATVGRVPRVRRKAVMMLGLSLGILVEETRALSEVTEHDLPGPVVPERSIA